MITEKFQYHTLSRATVDGKRLYETPDGNKLPSVTTILDCTKPDEKKKALNEWRKRIGTDRAQQITTDAANRGTRMHSYLENFVKSGVLPERGSNPYSWASHAMAEVVIKDGLHAVDEFWGVEVPLYFPSVYAGTTDLVGVHDGVESILDFKQTNKPKKDEWIDDYKLQLAAYAIAHNEVYGTEIQKGVILMCVKPEVDDETMRLLTVPQYQQWIIEGKEFEHWTNEWWKRVELYYLQ
jgi:CRISPR/Cas system-associated exonuclease Cas4 (RecB family)